MEGKGRREWEENEGRGRENGVQECRGREGITTAERGGRERDSGKEGERGERKRWALRPQKPVRLIRDEDVWGGGGREFLFLTPTRYTVTTRMTLREGEQLCEPFQCFTHDVGKVARQCP